MHNRVPARRVSNGEAVWVTNSHCAGGPGIQNFAFENINEDLIGTESVDPPLTNCYILVGGNPNEDCRYADAALISAVGTIDLGVIGRTVENSNCEDCYPSTDVDSLNPILQIVGRNGTIFENETLHKIGRTTGWTWGAVEDTCTSLETENWVKPCADRVDYQSHGGDSGSPVFSLSGGNAILRGIHFAGCDREENDFWCELASWFGLEDGYMSNLNEIELDLGSLIVFDPGPPVPVISGATQVAPNALCFWDASVTNYGYPPYSYHWSGLFSGTGSNIGGIVSTSGSLNVTVTDGVGRQNSTNIFVTVQSGLPPLCE